MKTRSRYRRHNLIESLESRQLLSFSPWGPLHLSNFAPGVSVAAGSSLSKPILVPGWFGSLGGTLATNNSGTTTNGTISGSNACVTSNGAGILILNPVTPTGSVDSGGTLKLGGGTLTLPGTTSQTTLTINSGTPLTNGTTLSGLNLGGVLIVNGNGSAGLTQTGPIVTGPIVLSGSGASTSINPNDPPVIVTTGTANLTPLDLTLSPSTRAIFVLLPTPPSVHNITFNNNTIEIRNATIDNSGPPLSDGFYKLFKYSGAVSGADAVTVTTSQSGVTLSLDLNQDPGYVDVHVVSNAAPAS